MSHLEELDPAPQTGDSWCSLLAAPLSSQCNPLKKGYDSAALVLDCALLKETCLWKMVTKLDMVNIFYEMK